MVPDSGGKLALNPPTFTVKSFRALTRAPPAVTYGMSQSKANPKRARPVVSDLILMASLAVQPGVGGVQMSETVFDCPDH